MQLLYPDRRYNGARAAAGGGGRSATRSCAQGNGTAIGRPLRRELERNLDDRPAEHPVSQPPGQQPACCMCRMRPCAPVSAVQRQFDLPLRQRAHDVPLLRLFGDRRRRRCPDLRRGAEACGHRHPAGAAGAARAVSWRRRCCAWTPDTVTATSPHEKVLRRI